MNILSDSKFITAGIACAAGSVIAETRPNLLVFLTDDQRADTLGCYNSMCPIQTPNIDRLAANGIRFDNAFVTTPICMVSRASILTGRYNCNTRLYQFRTPLPDDAFAESYPVHLKKAGYFTGAFGKYGVGVTPAVLETFDVFDGQAVQGPEFREYLGRTMHDAEWLTVKAGEFFEQIPSDRPFCLQLNYKEPHPTSVPDPVDDHLLDSHFFDRVPTDTPADFASLPEYVRKGYGRENYETDFNKDGDHNPFMRQYHEKIVSVDRSVGEVMNMLREKGLLNNTVVVFLSDHGTHFGEKQLGGKWTPYDASLHIPFIIVDPRAKVSGGTVCDEFVLNIDIAPTLLDLAGVAVPPVMDGLSLSPLLHGKSGFSRDCFFYEHYTSPAPIKYIPRNAGLRSKSEKYVRWIDTDPVSEEFYDLSADPLERNNLINNESYCERIEQVRRRFDEWREKNPSTYRYDQYGERPQSGAPEIDWEKFRQVRPEEYERIKTEIERLGVTWEQAMNDWEVRYEICSNAEYWY